MSFPYHEKSHDRNYLSHEGNFYNPSAAAHTAHTNNMMPGMFPSMTHHSLSSSQMSFNGLPPLFAGHIGLNTGKHQINCIYELQFEVACMLDAIHIVPISVNPPGMKIIGKTRPDIKTRPFHLKMFCRNIADGKIVLVDEWTIQGGVQYLPFPSNIQSMQTDYVAFGGDFDMISFILHGKKLQKKEISSKVKLNLGLPNIYPKLTIQPSNFYETIVGDIDSDDYESDEDEVLVSKLRDLLCISISTTHERYKDMNIELSKNISELLINDLVSSYFDSSKVSLVHLGDLIEIIFTLDVKELEIENLDANLQSLNKICTHLSLSLNSAKNYDDIKMNPSSYDFFSAIGEDAVAILTKYVITCLSIMKADCGLMSSLSLMTTDGIKLFMDISKSAISCSKLLLSNSFTASSFIDAGGLTLLTYLLRQQPVLPSSILFSLVQCIHELIAIHPDLAVSFYKPPELYYDEYGQLYAAEVSGYQSYVFLLGNLSSHSPISHAIERSLSYCAVYDACDELALLATQLTSEDMKKITDATLWRLNYTNNISSPLDVLAINESIDNNEIVDNAEFEIEKSISNSLISVHDGLITGIHFVNLFIHFVKEFENENDVASVKLFWYQLCIHKRIIETLVTLLHFSMACKDLCSVLSLSQLHQSQIRDFPLISFVEILQSSLSSILSKLIMHENYDVIRMMWNRKTSYMQAFWQLLNSSQHLLTCQNIEEFSFKSFKDKSCVLIQMREKQSLINMSSLAWSLKLQLISLSYVDRLQGICLILIDLSEKTIDIFSSSETLLLINEIVEIMSNHISFFIFIKCLRHILVNLENLIVTVLKSSIQDKVINRESCYIPLVFIFIICKHYQREYDLELIQLIYSNDNLVKLLDQFCQTLPIFIQVLFIESSVFGEALKSGQVSESPSKSLIQSMEELKIIKASASAGLSHLLMINSLFQYIQQQDEVFKEVSIEDCLEYLSTLSKWIKSFLVSEKWPGNLAKSSPLNDLSISNDLSFEYESFVTKSSHTSIILIECYLTALTYLFKLLRTHQELRRNTSTLTIILETILLGISSIQEGYSWNDSSYTGSLFRRIFNISLDLVLSYSLDPMNDVIPIMLKIAKYNPSLILSTLQVIAQYLDIHRHVQLESHLLHIVQMQQEESLMKTFHTNRVELTTSLNYVLETETQFALKDYIISCLLSSSLNIHESCLLILFNLLTLSSASNSMEIIQHVIMEIQKRWKLLLSGLIVQNQSVLEMSIDYITRCCLILEQLCRDTTIVIRCVAAGILDLFLNCLMEISTCTSELAVLLEDVTLLLLQCLTTCYKSLSTVSSLTTSTLLESFETTPMQRFGHLVHRLNIGITFILPKLLSQYIATSSWSILGQSIVLVQILPIEYIKTIVANLSQSIASIEVIAVKLWNAYEETYQQLIEATEVRKNILSLSIDVLPRKLSELMTLDNGASLIMEAHENFAAACYSLKSVLELALSCFIHYDIELYTLGKVIRHSTSVDARRISQRVQKSYTVWSTDNNNYQSISLKIRNDRSHSYDNQSHVISSSYVPHLIELNDLYSSSSFISTNPHKNFHARHSIIASSLRIIAECVSRSLKYLLNREDRPMRQMNDITSLKLEMIDKQCQVKGFWEDFKNPFRGFDISKEEFFSSKYITSKNQHELSVQLFYRSYLLIGNENRRPIYDRVYGRISINQVKSLLSPLVELPESTTNFVRKKKNREAPEPIIMESKSLEKSLESSIVSSHNKSINMISTNDEQNENIGVNSIEVSTSMNQSIPETTLLSNFSSFPLTFQVPSISEMQQHTYMSSENDHMYHDMSTSGQNLQQHHLYSMQGDSMMYDSYTASHSQGLQPPPQYQQEYQQDYQQEYQHHPQQQQQYQPQYQHQFEYNNSEYSSYPTQFPQYDTSQQPLEFNTVQDVSYNQYYQSPVVPQVPQQQLQYNMEVTNTNLQFPQGAQVVTQPPKAVKRKSRFHD